MGLKFKNYDLFFRFIKTYLPVGFEGINRKDSLLLELEQFCEENNQFFFIGDMIKFKLLFTSEGCLNLFGIRTEDFGHEKYFEIRHPDDVDRHLHLRQKLFKTAHEIYNEGKGQKLLSSIFRIRNSENKYSVILFQCYLFFSETPHRTVYLFELLTLIDGNFKRKYDNHHYYGSDLTYFRYPDEKLINTGFNFSKREFQVIQFLARGLNTHEIAEKLNVSPFTINTHRSNILQKTGKKSIPELIAWLIETGII
jgi:DNA-binding CsgD family transcriptional regulator